MARRSTALITNDDGIESHGLRHLARAALNAGLDVVIAAPAVEASGSSASITATEMDGRILLEKRRLEGFEDITAHAVHAGPGLITLLAAHGTFGAVPDLVLSGINRGANVGRAILHSGTVGAALTGGVNCGKAMAVSQQVPGNSSVRDWSAAATLAEKLIPLLMQQPEGTVLNLNIPTVEGDTVPELRAAGLAEFGVVQTTMAEQVEDYDDYVRLAVSDPTDQPRPDSDAALLAEGFATVTAIRSVAEDPSLDLTAGLQRIEY